jgi:transcriptional regulator GlxA family with amidase domain
MKIDLLLYDGCDELDVIGPYETLTVAAGAGARFDVRLVTLTTTSGVMAAHGTRIQPQGRLAESPDVVIVPGGGWINHAARGARAELARGELPRAVAARHAAGATIASVCTGALLLAAAGLLAGRPATTHHGALADLRAAGADLIDDARVVDDGDVLTAGGVTSGIDLALWIVERSVGAAAADATAGALEYRYQRSIWRSQATA